MKDEIKDLLQYLKNVYESEETSTWLNKLQIKDLLDYITNLQEKCESLDEAYKNLQEELEVSQTNEETFRLEMQDITKCLGLDKHTIFDEVKEYATNLQEENERLKVNCNVGNENLTFYRNGYKDYKTRNEKASTYIEHYLIGNILKAENCQRSLKYLLNILQKKGVMNSEKRKNKILF